MVTKKLLPKNQVVVVQLFYSFQFQLIKVALPHISGWTGWDGILLGALVQLDHLVVLMNIMIR